jgi:hypothetical protein
MKQNSETKRSPSVREQLTEGEGSVQLTSSLKQHVFVKKVNNVFNIKSS